MRWLVFVLALTISACASAPPNLTPAAQRAYYANEVVVAIGTLQHAAIELNKVQVGTPPHALLSDADTRVVVEAVTDALTAIRAVPDGWKATASVTLDRIQQRLSVDARSHLAPYLAAVRAFLVS